MTSSPVSSANDTAFADLVEELTARFQSGESIDPSEVLRDHPEHAERLRELLPALKMLANLSQSVSKGGVTISTSDGDPFTGDLGDFRLIREIGRGGMGIVYEAEQISLNRKVALKVLPFAATMDPRQLQRFKNEALAAASLRHENIVHVYGVGSDRGVHYYAMELIEGQTLAEVIKDLSPQPPSRSGKGEQESRPPFPLREGGTGGLGSTAPIAALSTKRDRAHYRSIAELIASAADALEYAHSMGVVHRDIKPGNMMLDNAGHLWVADFGLAKLANPALHGAVNVTLTDDRIGTLRYSSPEQALAKHGLVDHRTDIYSLGATLYELLTLQPAVQGADKAEILKQIAFEEPTPLRKLDKSIPAELETITLKCLAKEPGERYATAGEVAEDLRRWVQDKPIQAKSPGLAIRALRWCRHHPSTAGLYSFLLFGVLVAIAAALAFQRHELQQELERAAGERRLRATALCDALATADIASVPATVSALAMVREEALPVLRQRVAAVGLSAQERMRYALTLLEPEPERADDLIAVVPIATPAELLVLRDALHAHAERVTALWPQLAHARPEERLQLAALLADFVPADERWQPFAADLAKTLVSLNPLELASWMPLFKRLDRQLTPALLEIYANEQRVLSGGGLSPAEMTAATVRLDLSAALLARTAARDENALAGLLVTADARHYAAFAAAARDTREPVMEALRRVARLPPVTGTEDAAAAAASRQANAAAALFSLGDPDPTWRLFRHSCDPTARSYLVHALGPRGISASVLANRYSFEPDISARRALLLALGECDTARMPREEFDRLAARLLDDFRDHDDAGLHAAIDWLLRRRWGRAAVLDTTRAALAKQPRGDRQWFVNASGQTFTVIKGPVEFRMGSPEDEPGRERGDAEVRHTERIPRSFAIAAREVTVEEYRRYRSDYDYRRHYAPAADGPINDTSWYEAAAYCRWLSEQEKLPESEMCYPKLESIGPGMKLPNDLLSRSGYRLPTEAEWEYACRAGAATARPYGRGTELLGHYAWWQRNAGDRLQPCGMLKPNDLGLVDTLGNAFEWCHDTYMRRTATPDDRRTLPPDDELRILRGACFINLAPDLRCAMRYWPRSGHRHYTVGFRLARTLP